MSFVAQNVKDPAGAPGKAAYKGTLLIVDDEDAPRKSLEMVFRGAFKILTASDGPTAIRLAQENQVDVAISDIRMVGMSGLEVLERLKFVDPSIEVIILTAYETTDTVRQALKLRACDFLNKPFDVSAIRGAVNGAMQRRAARMGSGADTGKLLQELENQKIEEQMAQTRGDIYASIIHDLKGPLSVIGGFAQVLGMRLAGTEKLEGAELQFLKDKLQTISQQVTTCSQISNRYLSFLRNRSGEVTRAGVNELLRDVGNLLRMHPARNNHELVIEPLKQDVAVEMNGTDLIQILQNLAINAFQCCDTPHSVQIHGHVVVEPLNLSSMADSPYERFLNIEGFSNAAPILILSVSDTGPGIPAAVFPRIFQPYFTTKGSRQGTGLGLSIVQRLVKEASAALHVRSVPHEGTTFSIYIPAVCL